MKKQLFILAALLSTTASLQAQDEFDALDVYGKTKSLGEIPDANVMHLRCSLIGPELGRNSLFFEWVRQQPHGAAPHPGADPRADHGAHPPAHDRSYYGADDGRWW